MLWEQTAYDTERYLELKKELAGLRPYILLDVDGVLGDFITHLHNEVRARFGADLPDPSTYTSRDLFATYTAEQKVWAESVLASPGFARTMPLMPCAQEAVRLLQSVGRVVVVTAPWVDSPTWEFDRRAALKAIFGFTHKDIVFTHQKHLVQGATLVDDHVSHVQNWRAANRSPSVLFAHGYNLEEGKDEHFVIPAWGMAAVVTVLEAARFGASKTSHLQYVGDAKEPMQDQVAGRSD